YRLKEFLRLHKFFQSCVRIKSVAFGSCLILAYLALRAWKRWAAAQTCLGTLSPDPFFASRRF
ncbi:MAG: hypothetical protein IJB85_08125, partial [Clostridia bacterium]|nr:hypothetical protein [Clostridia bacterium]